MNQKIELSKRLNVKSGVGPKTGQRFWTLFDEQTLAAIVLDDNELDALAREAKAFEALETERNQLRAALVNLHTHFEMQKATDGFALEILHDETDPLDPFDIEAAMKQAQDIIERTAYNR